MAKPKERHGFFGRLSRKWRGTDEPDQRNGPKGQGMPREGSRGTSTSKTVSGMPRRKDPTDVTSFSTWVQGVAALLVTVAAGNYASIQGYSWATFYQSAPFFAGNTPGSLDTMLTLATMAAGVTTVIATDWYGLLRNSSNGGHGIWTTPDSASASKRDVAAVANVLSWGVVATLTVVALVAALGPMVAIASGLVVWGLSKVTANHVTRNQQRSLSSFPPPGGATRLYVIGSGSGSPLRSPGFRTRGLGEKVGSALESLVAALRGCLGHPFASEEPPHALGSPPPSQGSPPPSQGSPPPSQGWPTPPQGTPPKGTPPQGL